MYVIKGAVDYAPYYAGYTEIRPGNFIYHWVTQKQLALQYPTIFHAKIAALFIVREGITRTATIEKLTES